MVAVRVATGSGSPTTSVSATFSNPTPLDSSHLLVAIIQLSPSVTATATGWTEAAGSGADVGAATATRVFARQGNGSVNSVTFSLSATDYLVGVVLLAFEGFVSTTALVGNGGTSASTTQTQTLTPSSTPPGFGIAIAVAGLSDTSTSQSWSGGYSAITSPDGYLWTSQRDYDDSDSFATVFTWLSFRRCRWQTVIYPLAAPATVSYALGSTPRTLALGDTPVQAWKGAGAP
jgi:hypothetical protein